MKKIYKKIIAMCLMCILIIFLVSCNENKGAIDNNPETPVKGESNLLVAYFSWSGNTQQLATMIAEKSGAEIFRIIPEVAYTNEDVFDRAQNELNDGIRPPLAEHIDEAVMKEYDVVFIGFPIWWYDLPTPIWTFLEEYNFNGKTIIPFFTHNGSSSGAGSISTLERLCPQATIFKDYLSIRGNNVGAAESQVVNWLNKLGINMNEVKEG